MTNAEIKTVIRNAIGQGEGRSALTDKVMDAVTAAGFVIVPEEPTEAMLKCSHSNWSGFMADDPKPAAGKLYRAMLRAAQESK